NWLQAKEKGPSGTAVDPIFVVMSSKLFNNVIGSVSKAGTGGITAILANVSKGFIRLAPHMYLAWLAFEMLRGTIQGIAKDFTTWKLFVKNITTDAFTYLKEGITSGIDWLNTKWLELSKSLTN